MQCMNALIKVQTGEKRIMNKFFSRIFHNKTCCQLVLMGMFVLILAAVQGCITPDFRDDLAYMRVWQNQSLLEFLEDRYEGWSSRLIIEAVMMLMVKHVLVWRILNIAMILLLVWAAADLFGIGNRLRAQLIFFAEIWTVPFTSLCNAGWITTTVNYLWVLALGILAMRPVKHSLRDEKCPKWEYVVCPLCVLYAANMEQMGAVLLGVYLVFGAYLLYQRRLQPLFIVQLLLIVVSLLFILSVPGNAVRILTETERHFPAYADMNVGEKLWMGFLESGNYYIAGGYQNLCCVFGCLSGVLFFSYAAKQGRVCRKAEGGSSIQGSKGGSFGRAGRYLAAMFPFVSHLCCAYLFPYLLWDANISRGRNLLWALSANRYIPSQSDGVPVMIVIQTCFYLAVLVCVGCLVFLIHGRSGETLFQLLVLGAGVASRMLMSFSPTIYASGDRTALFCSAAILIVILRNLQLSLDRGVPWRWKICLGGCLAGSVLLNIF